MWKYIEQKILRINKATGAEIVIQPDDRWMLHLCQTRIKNNEVIEDSSTSIETEAEAALARFSKEIPVALVINGKGILTKMISTPAEKQNAFAAILPGANPSDFYYQQYEVGNHDLISIIRKEALDNILSGFKAKQLKVLSVALGVSPLNSIIGFLDSSALTDIATSTFKLEFSKKGSLDLFTLKAHLNESDLTAESEYRVANQYIKSNRLLSFATSVSLLADRLSFEPPVPSSIIAEERREYKHYRYFRFSGLTLLSLLFIILLSGFLAYSHYYALSNELANTQPINEQQNKKAKKTEQDISQKERFLSRSGWVNQSKTSYYADRIAALTPGDIMLRSMSIYPVKTGAGDDGSMRNKKDTIEITGICYDPSVLNQFVNGLKVLPDFSSATVRNYQYRKEEEAGAFSVEVVTRK